MKITPIFLLLAFVSFGVNAGKFYKWEDDEGVVHYTAIAPGNRASETVNTQSGEHRPSRDQQASDKTTGKTSSKTEADKKVAENETGLEKPPEPKKPETAPPTKPELKEPREETEKKCAVTRKNLETMNTRARVRIEDPDTGQLRYLSPEEINSRKAIAQKNIDQFCN